MPADSRLGSLRRRSVGVVEIIRQNDRLGASAKESLVSLVEDAASAAAAAADQGIGEVLCTLTWATVMHIVDDPARSASRSWRDVVIACRREIVVAVAIVSLLLLLRPQIVSIVDACCK